MRDGMKYPHHHKQDRLGFEGLDRHKESDKDAARDFILKNKVVSREHADQLLAYWQHTVRRSDEFDSPGAAKVMVDKLKQDLGLLKELRFQLKMQKQDPVAVQQVPALQNLIRLLELLFDKLEKRWWLLRRKAWAYVATLNTAFPKKHLQLEKKKDKKDKAQEAMAAATKKKEDE